MCTSGYVNLCNPGSGQQLQEKLLSAVGPWEEWFTLLFYINYAWNYVCLLILKNAKFHALKIPGSTDNPFPIS